MDGMDITAEYEKLRAVYLQFMPWYRSQYDKREGMLLKNLLLNLKWNRCLSTAHPRERLYDLVTELLNGGGAPCTERFYHRQRRFS
jgi:hypothetical protein